MARKPIPKPSFLDGCAYLGVFNGERRWRDRAEGHLYTWDSLHGELRYSRSADDTLARSTQRRAS